MTEYYGDFPEDYTNVQIPFNTFDSNDPSASVTITNLADSDIHVHKDGSITQAVTDGATVVINFDGITGNHMITIDTSAHAFYATGSEYAVRVEGTTVDAGTINAWVGSFSIERAGGALALIKALNDVAATDIVSAGAITTSSGAVSNVTLVATTTTNTDVRGTDSAALASVATEARLAELDAANLPTDIADIPTVAEFNARTLAAASYFDPATDAVANVTLVATTTTNTDVRGTDSALLAASINLTGGAVDNVTTVSNATVVAGTASFFQDYFLVDSGEVSGNEVSGSVLLEGTKINADRILTGATHNINNSWGKRVRQIDAAFEVHSGTAQAGTSTTITLDTGANSTNDNIYRGDRVLISSGTGQGEHGICITYASSTRIATMSESWIVTPDATSEFILIPASVDIETWQHNIVTASASGLPDVNVNEVGDTAQTAGDLAALITTVDGVVDTILLDTADIQPKVAKIPLSDGVITWNATALASINAEADTALTDYDPPTRTEATSDKDEIVTDLTDIKGTGFVKDTHSLIDIEAFVDILDDGTSGNVKIAADAAAILVDTADIQPKIGTPATDVSADIAAVKAETALIVADTNELQTDWTNAGRLDAILDAILAMLDDPRAEPGQGSPAVNPDAMTKIDYLYKSWRNKKDNDGSTTQLYADDGSTVDQKQTTSESGGTVTKAEWATGP